MTGIAAGWQKPWNCWLRNAEQGNGSRNTRKAHRFESMLSVLVSGLDPVTFESNMAKKKSKAFPWSKAGSAEIKKFTDYVEHCRHFAETIARRKEHSAVTEEDVADAIQEYAALWAGQCSKPAKVIKSVAPKKKKAPALPLDEATQRRIAELEVFIREEEEVGDTGFGDPKARIAHWRDEIETLKRPKTRK